MLVLLFYLLGKFSAAILSWLLICTSFFFLFLFLCCACEKFNTMAAACTWTHNYAVLARVPHNSLLSKLFSKHYMLKYSYATWRFLVVHLYHFSFFCIILSQVFMAFWLQCEDPRCRVWQHIICVVIPEKPMEGVQPEIPSCFYCELCRTNKADP